MKLARLGSLVLSAVLVAASCSTGDADAEVRARLAAAQAAAEARDLGFFRDFVGSGYRDAHGNDREQVLNLLRGLFIAHQKIEIFSAIEEVRLEGSDAAHVIAQVGLAGQRSGESLRGRLSGDLYRFDVELIEDGGEWRMIGATWDRGAGE